MKKIMLLIVVLAALTVFCSAAFAQYGYNIPSLETVRRDGSTVNVYTYRDAYGRPYRTIEYYVNDGGGYGNKDSYFDNQGRLTFKIENDYEKNGEHKVSEERISYSENDLQYTDSRITTFDPNGTQRIFTYTSRETENHTVETSGMFTDGQGAKIYDFKEVTYKDKDRNMVLESTLYYPDKSVHQINEVYKTDQTTIREERTFDANGRNTYYQSVKFDANENETSSETSYYTYKDGTVISEKLLIDNEEGRMLRYTEKHGEYGPDFIGEGMLLDLKGNKLADYRTEGTENKDGSEYRVDSYVYPDGKVDLISQTVDADGNMKIRTQLDFQAAGEKTGETSDDDSVYKNFYDRTRYEWLRDIDEPDDELIDYFEEVNEVWNEKYDGDTKDLTEEFNDVLEDLLEDFNNDPDAATDDSSGETDDIAEDLSEDSSSFEPAGADDRNGDEGPADDFDGDEGGSDDPDEGDGGYDD